MNNHQEGVKEAVKRFVKWSYSKFENGLNLSWERRKVQFLHFVIYIVAILIILIGAIYELYDTITSGDGSFVVAYIVIISMAFSEGVLLMMKRIRNIEEMPKRLNYTSDEIKFHMVKCVTKFCPAVYVVVGCHDRLPSVRETGRNQKVHLMVLIVSYAFPMASSGELIAACRKVYREKKDPERTGDTHG